MGDFFHGWRRKIGVVTLVLACVFTFGWVRSQSFADSLSVASGTTRLHCVKSMMSRIGWTSDWSIQDDVELNHQQDPGFSFTSEALEEPMEPKDAFRFFLSDGMRLPFFGFQFGFQRGSHIHSFIAIVPYWSIVIPLTVLSAYLLLVKPRSSSQMKPVEPIAEKVE